MVMLINMMVVLNYYGIKIYNYLLIFINILYLHNIDNETKNNKNL